jgi:dienelactone hydrolase
MEIRRYVPGDSPRHILWKIYARTGQLNVRLPERSIDPAKKTVAYLLAGEGDEASAAAARVALENGLLGVAWLFGADGNTGPLDELPAALEAIARSGSPASRGPGQLRAFLQHPAVRKEMHCIVFAPAQPGPWMEEVIAAGRSFGGQLTFVLGTDGAIEERPVPLWRRLLFYDEPVPGPTRSELQGLVRTLATAGRSVLVVDRSNGRVQSSGNAPMLQTALGVPA